MRPGPQIRLAAAAAFVAAAGAVGTPAEAVDESDFMIDNTAQLAALCTAPETDPNHARAVQMCHGYLLGVHHFHTALAVELDDDIYCLPPGGAVPTRNEAAASFSDWVAANPGIAETEALDGLLTWAAQTYPCN